MDADPQQGQIHRQGQVAEGTRCAAGLKEFQSQPEDRQSQHHRDAVNLGFHGIAPVRTGKCSEHRAGEATDVADEPCHGGALFGFVPVGDHAHNDQVGEEGDKGRGDNRDRVDAHGDITGDGKFGEEAAEDNEQR